MAVSSFFPHAPPPRYQPPPAEPSFITTTAPAAPIRSAPPSSDRTSAAVGLRFPAARSVLWDRTPQGDKLTLRAPTVRLVLSSNVLERLCGQARDARTGHALGSLSAEAERGLSRVGQRALAPLVLSVSSSAQPASHVQPQTCTVAVRVEPWYDGDGPCPSEEVYASLVSCSDLGFGGARRPSPWDRPIAPAHSVASRFDLRPPRPAPGARPLCLGGALPMSLTASTSPDGRLLQLRVEALVPTIELSAVALYALRVHPTTLSEALLHVRPRTPRARQQRGGGCGGRERTRGRRAPLTASLPARGSQRRGVRRARAT